MEYDEQGSKAGVLVLCFFYSQLSEMLRCNVILVTIFMRINVVFSLTF